MTWPEIQAAYPDCWVMLGELDSDPVTFKLYRAVVRGWGKTRRECIENSQLVAGELTARKYTGPIRSPWHP